jgi:glutathione S-transferase
MTEKMKVYGDSRSGNCYKVQLLCAELGLRYDWQEVDILAGETRTPQFLAMNPNGKIPLLALPDGQYLPESNAILCYLADGHALAGEDRFGRARILQWLFFEQYSHEPNIATSRFIIRYLGNPAERSADLVARKTGGYAALDVMEKQLLNSDFIAGETFSVADIALFAYTHVAHEGGFDLASYPAIRAWIRKISRRPSFVAMKKT